MKDHFIIESVSDDDEEDFGTFKVQRIITFYLTYKIDLLSYLRIYGILEGQHELYLSQCVTNPSSYRDCSGIRQIRMIALKLHEALKDGWKVELIKFPQKIVLKIHKPKKYDLRNVI